MKRLLIFSSTIVIVVGSLPTTCKANSIDLQLKKEVVKPQPFVLESINYEAINDCIINEVVRPITSSVELDFTFVNVEQKETSIVIPVAHPPPRCSL